MCGGAKRRLILPVERLQEFVAQDGRGLSAGGIGDEIHVVLLTGRYVPLGKADRATWASPTWTVLRFWPSRGVRARVKAQLPRVLDRLLRHRVSVATPGETPRVADPTWRKRKGWNCPLRESSPYHNHSNIYH